MSGRFTSSRLLAVAERLPRPDESSGSCRFLAILGHLAREGRVTLWVERDETHGRTALPASRVASDRVRLQELGVTVLPCGFASLRESLRDERHDIALFETYEMASQYLPAVRDWQPDAALVVDSVDVHFARLHGAAAIGAYSSRRARRVRQRETAIYRAADAVIAVSAADGEILRAEPCMPSIMVVPNCVTLRPRVLRRRSPTALFVGHFDHAPNLDGLSWFVRDVWPQVRRRSPDARLTVIGSYATSAVQNLGQSPGVDVLGYVPDLTPPMDQAVAAIAPLRYGAGMKGKVTDAMAAGVPVVTTSVGAQGLDIIDGRHALVADQPAAFADALVRLFDDQDQAAVIGLAGQHHVDRLCGQAAIAASLSPLLQVQRRVADPARPRSRFLSRLRLVRLGLRHWGWSQAGRHAAWLVPRPTRLTGAGTGQPRG